MKKMKVIVKIILFFTIYIGVQYGIRYAILDDTRTISRVMMHDLYTQEQNIDILFCGASHCQLGFDTEILDRTFGKNTFNAGSSSQGLETTLALIKEADAYNDLQQVYVDLDYSIVMRQVPNLESIYIIADYMKLSPRKVEYLLNATSAEYYVNSFMPIHKGRGYMKNPRGIPELLHKKMQSGYRDYMDVDSSYAGKGHIASRTVIENGSLWSEDTLSEMDFTIPETQQEYLREIIRYCQEQNIQLTFVSIPVTDFHLAHITNYDEYVDTITNFLDKYDVKYYDFNLCDRSMLQIDEDAYFNDDNHLNADGSANFSKAFAEFFMGEIDGADLFYETLLDRWMAEKVRVLGVEVHQNDEVLEVYPILNRTETEENQVPECEVRRKENGYAVTVKMNGMITNQIEIKDEELR